MPATVRVPGGTRVPHAFATSAREVRRDARDADHERVTLRLGPPLVQVARACYTARREVGSMRWWIVLAGFLVAPSPLPAQQAPPTAAAYAVFALESATLGPGARVDAGNVGANRGTVRL